jgi:hypothetical protein
LLPASATRYRRRESRDLAIRPPPDSGRIAVLPAKPSERAGGWVDRRWQIAVFYPDEKVTEVLASTGLVGP